MRTIDADALIQALEKKHEHWREIVSDEYPDIEFAHTYAVNVIRNAPTADAKPTVIRSRTLLPTKDFMEWAKRIREENPNAVVIPCDAEVASTESKQGEWIDIDNYYRMATCSHCHKVTMFEKWGEYTKPYDYCPNCGAKMYREGGEAE